MTEFCIVCLEDVEENKLMFGICIYCWRRHKDRGCWIKFKDKGKGGYITN